MLRLASLAIILGVPLVTVPAAAQQTLGGVLDGGAKRMSVEEFEVEIVQRALIGPAPTGGELEIMYASKGSIVGAGRHPNFEANTTVFIGGEWKLDEAGRICSSMKIGGVPLPYRCQYWYKLADKYYVSDSDVDRSAKVLSRAIKR